LDGSTEFAPDDYRSPSFADLFGVTHARGNREYLSRAVSSGFAASLQPPWRRKAEPVHPLAEPWVHEGKNAA